MSNKESNDKPEKLGNAFEKIREGVEMLARWKTVFSIVFAALTGVAGGAVAMWLNTRSAAQAAVTEEKFLSDLAARIRPGCIFDGAGVIAPNFGAAELVESIKVKSLPQVYGFEVTIKFKKHLEKEPIVTGLNVNLYPSEVKRGPMNTWTFSLTPAFTMQAILGEGGGLQEKAAYKFKLEILH